MDVAHFFSILRTFVGLSCLHSPAVSSWLPDLSWLQSLLHDSGTIGVHSCRTCKCQPVNEETPWICLSVHHKSHTNTLGAEGWTSSSSSLQGMMIDEADEFVTGPQNKGKRPGDSNNLPGGGPKRRRCMSPLLRLGKAYTPPVTPPGSPRHPTGDVNQHCNTTVTPRQIKPLSLNH